MSEVAAAAREGRFNWQRVAEYVIVVAIVVEAAVFAAIAPQFLSFPNLVNVALSIAITGILAVGMTMVILTGGIDLSVGSVVALAGVVAALLVDKGAGVAVGALAAVGVGLAVGLFNGVTVAQFRVPPFVTTLAMLTICRGLAFIVTGGRGIGNLPESFGFVGKSRVFDTLPLPVLLMLVVVAAGWFLLRHTVFGRHVYAVGGNREAAFLAGVNTKRVTALTYVLNGLLVGLAGFVLASRLGAGVPNTGVQYELDVISAVVVGGTSLMGGRGSVIGTFWGAVFIGVLNNGLNLAGVDPYMQKIALGVVLLLAVFADQAGKSKGAIKT
ncbi:MAG TPA: ABC transporter permease [Pyrinomonadaceae bacterium]|jgi:ribose/xylose/arabinose/galactoside ABC-type transport system permease subunit|nr:ABC transporter permease [Pyrinomonadaceae bacterium]